MLSVILSIFSSLGLYIIFKVTGKIAGNNFSLILINYITASLIGIFLLLSLKLPIVPADYLSWLPYSLSIGVLFIVMFFFIAKSAQVAGIGITAIASKTSVIFPILLSILIDPSDKLTTVKLTGICMSVMALVLTVYKKNNDAKTKIWLPFILFIGVGLTDSLIKFAQHKQINTSNSLVFSTWIFFISAISGIIGGLIFKQKFKDLFNKKILFWGIMLGIFNLGSIYFIMMALNSISVDGSSVFGMVNVGIVALSAIVGWFLFHEKISKINLMGIILAILAITLLSAQT